LLIVEGTPGPFLVGGGASACKTEKLAATALVGELYSVAAFNCYTSCRRQDVGKRC